MNSIIGDDFLSNGLHQLYKELQDDVAMWDDHRLPHNLNENLNYDQMVDSYGCSSYYQNSYSPSLDDSALLLTPQIDLEIPEWNKSSVFATELYHHNSWTTTELCNFEWELNLDNLLLDNSKWDDNTSATILPERTLLCNDSCDIFLKESSENLKLDVMVQRIKTNERSMHPVASIENRLKVTNETDDKFFPCTFGSCKKIYAKPAHLKAHLRRHMGDKPYVCTWPNCTWKFSRSDELARHRRSHYGIKPYKCDYCPKCFARSDHLAKHRKVHERKLAAGKAKGIWKALPPAKPGRKPNLNKCF